MLFYELNHKRKFRTQLLALPPVDAERVLEKVEFLRIDPAPNAKNKKRLKGYDDPIYRIRCGDYRITYSFDQGRGWVDLLGVAHRKHVYDDDWALEPDEEAVGEQPSVGSASLLHPSIVHPAPRGSVPRGAELPRLIDDDFLGRICVPEEYHPRLCRCRTLDDLIGVEAPASVLEAVFDAVTDDGYDRVLRAPSYRIDSTDDLRRFLQGDLVTFLLRLDPDQERFTEWGAQRGPVLLKGGPGTGKSIVAIYRARSLVLTLQRAGIAEPRVLFSTYTNALVKASRQLLAQLLGSDAGFVEVRTADDVVASVLESAGEGGRALDDGQSRDQVEKARRTLEAGTDADRELMRSITSLSLEYLREEIDAVILGREHGSREAYLRDRRSGRRVGLSEVQRSAVWRVYEKRERLMSGRSERAYAQRRHRAAELVRSGACQLRYDGVIIDEAQDLPPSLIRFFVGVCASTDRLMLTADPNQSVYGSGFRWQDVHADLKFRGRTSVLRRSYRSTKEISDAARAYLAGAELDDQDDGASDIEYVRTGPMPRLVLVSDEVSEVTAIAGFLRQGTRNQHVGLGSCAVLVMSKDAGRALVARLTRLGLRAGFQEGRHLDLLRPEIKVLTLQSAKGLEFPVTAVLPRALEDAGRFGASQLPEEIEEAARLRRRLLYVAMTRATEELLVVVRSGPTAQTPAGFSERHWQIERIAGR